MEDPIYYPMTDIPEKEHQADNFSKTVLIYELDKITKAMYDVALGYYNFNTRSWFVVGGDSILAYCWTELPYMPSMKKRSFNPINIE